MNAYLDFFFFLIFFFFLRPTILKFWARPTVKPFVYNQMSNSYMLRGAMLSHFTWRVGPIYQSLSLFLFILQNPKEQNVPKQKIPKIFTRLSVCLDSKCVWRLHPNLGPVHCSPNPQISFLAKFSLKISLTTQFTHFKIILLQYFQFLVFNF